MIDPTVATAERHRFPVTAPRRNHRFEAQHSTHWVGWVRHDDAPMIEAHGSWGRTISCVVATADAEVGDRVATLGDVRDRQGLDGLRANAGFLRLAPGGACWDVSWPTDAGAVWLYSTTRLPQLWPIERGPEGDAWRSEWAHPGDLLIAAWTQTGRAAVERVILQQGHTGGRLLLRTLHAMVGAGTLDAAIVMGVDA